MAASATNGAARGGRRAATAPPATGAASDGASNGHAGVRRSAAKGATASAAPSRRDEQHEAPNGRETSGDAVDAMDAMNAVTVAEAQRVVLPGNRVAGGAAGLARRVTWATSLRSRPPAFEPRGGGEFVLAGREALDSLRQADHSLTLPRVLEGLAQAGAAALACAAPVGAEAIAAADTLELPLIALAAGTSPAALVAAERGIIGLVLDRHNELQARASQFYRQLAQVSVESLGLEAILQAAAIDTGLFVAFEDHLFRLRAVAAPQDQPPPPVDDAGLSSVTERGRLAEAVRTQPLSSITPQAIVLSAVRWRMERTTAPVVTRERLRGYVSLCGPQSMTEFDQLAVSRLAAVCAIELASEDRVLAAEQRVQGDLVDELLRPYGEAGAAARHAVQAGLARQGTFAVFVFEEAAGREAASGLAEALGRHLRSTTTPALVKRDAGEVIAICQLADGTAAAPPSGGPQRAPPGGPAAAPDPDPNIPSDAAVLEGLLQTAGRHLFDAAAAAADGTVTAGVSRAHVGLGALPVAAREAADALRIGRLVYGPGRLILYADLGLYRLLHSLRDTPELAGFFEQTLGPLAEYDRRTGQNLIETLEAFFACHGKLSETAQRLGYHRNSLMYRLRRIQEIGGVDLDDPETRLSLQVALKAKRLLS